MSPGTGRSLHSAVVTSGAAARRPRVPRRLPRAAAQGAGAQALRGAATLAVVAVAQVAQAAVPGRAVTPPAAVLDRTGGTWRHRPPPPFARWSSGFCSRPPSRQLLGTRCGGGQRLGGRVWQGFWRKWALHPTHGCLTASASVHQVGAATHRTWWTQQEHTQQAVSMVRFHQSMSVAVRRVCVTRGSMHGAVGVGAGQGVSHHRASVAFMVVEV